MELQQAYDEAVANGSDLEKQMAALNALEAQQGVVSKLSAEYDNATIAANNFHQTMSEYEQLLVAYEQGGEALDAALARVEYSFKSAGTATIDELKAQQAELQTVYDNLVQDVVNGNTNISKSQLDTVLNLLEQSKTEVSNATADLKTEARASMSDAGRGIMEVLDGLVLEVPGKANDLTSGFTAGLAAGGSDAEYAAEQIKTLCESALKGDTSQYGYDFMQGYLNAILASDPSDEVAAMVQQALDAIAATQQSHSPSKITEGHGGDFTDGYAQGITGGTGNATAAAGNMAEQVLAVLRGKSPNASPIGAETSGQYASGISGAIGAVTTAATNITDGALAKLSEAQGKLKTSGEASAGDYASGVSGGSGDAEAAGEELGTNAVSGAESGAAGADSVGVNLALGIARGIQSQISNVAQSASNLVKNAVNAAKAAADINSPSRVMRDEVGVMLSLGTAQGIKLASDKVADAAQDMTENTTQTLTDGFAKAGAESVLALAKGMSDNAEDLSKNIVSQANDWLSTQEHFDRISAKQTVDFWEEILKSTDLGADEVLDVEKKLYTARISQSKESYDKSKKWIDNEKFYNRLSAEEEVAAWTRVVERENQLAEQQLEAKKNLYTAEHALMKEQQAATDEFNKQQQASIDEINKSIESRVSSLQSSLGGIWGEFKAEDLGDTSLLQNIEGQIDALEEFQTALAALAEKGYADAIILQLDEEGPAAISKIQQLASYTQDEMERYNEAFATRNDLIAQQARSDAYKEVGEENLLALLDGMTDEQKLLNQNIVLMAEECIETAGSFRGDFADTGKNMMLGVADGILSGQSSVYDAVEQVARGILSTMQSALDIHSPSRKMASLVGAPAAQGIGVGFLDEMKEVYRQMRETVDMEMGRMSAEVSVTAAKQAAPVSPTKEFYTEREKTESVLEIKVDDSSSNGLIREIAKALRVEERRTGSRMIQGGTP